MFGWLTIPDGRKRASLTLLALVSVGMGACANRPPAVPYPAFIQSAELPDIFVAGLPGIRAKRFAGNPETRRSSNLLILPADWSFSTGGAPNKSVEIYVLSGNVSVGEFELAPGGYAYVPDGSTGVPLKTAGGARILYFLDDANPDAVIQTPLISNQSIVPWRPLLDDPNDLGLSVKELRADPGSGARTWLLRIDPGATRAWQSLSVIEEGYMLEGNYTHSECVGGKPATGSYFPGGYYHRPAGAVNGGPESAAVASSVWFLRTLSTAETTVHAGCVASAAP